MTQISEESRYPTEWRIINVISGVKCRQISDDTFELWSSDNIITLNREGFNLYREGPTEKFEEYLDTHNVPLRKADAT